MAADPFHVLVPGFDVIQGRERSMDGNAYAHETVDQIHRHIGSGGNVQVHFIHPVIGQVLLQCIGSRHDRNRFNLRILIPDHIQGHTHFIVGRIVSHNCKAGEPVDAVIRTENSRNDRGNLGSLQRNKHRVPVVYMVLLLQEGLVNLTHDITRQQVQHQGVQHDP